jgi:hypothetical protein
VRDRGGQEDHTRENANREARLVGGCHNAVVKQFFGSLPCFAVTHRARQWNEAAFQKVWNGEL